MSFTPILYQGRSVHLFVLHWSHKYRCESITKRTEPTTQQGGFRIRNPIVYVDRFMNNNKCYFMYALIASIVDIKMYLTYLSTIGRGSYVSVNLPPIVNFFVIIIYSPVIFTFLTIKFFHYIWVPLYTDVVMPKLKRVKETNKKSKVYDNYMKRTTKWFQMFDWENISKLKERLEASDELKELYFNTLVRLLGSEESLWTEVDIQRQIQEEGLILCK